MIIVEGPDGGGKSTLVQRLAEDLDMPVAPRVVGVDTKAMVDLKLWVEENVDLGFHEKIYDRHRLISEPIYGLLMNRTQPGFDDMNWMGAMTYRFYALNPIVIYCIPPKYVMLHNIRSGPADNSAVEAKAEWIYNGYVARAAVDLATQPYFYRYDYTVHDYDEMLEHIELRLEKEDG